MMNNSKTIYTQSPIVEYRGNPLIEALPPIVDDKIVLKKLGYFPKFTNEERSLSPEIRKHLVNRIENIVVPFPEYLQAFRMIEGALLRAYSRKNPFSPTTTHYLHYLSERETVYKPITGVFQPEGTVITIEGISGAGKTHMVKRILRTFKQCIHHTEYEGQNIYLDQVVWVFVECPSDGSLSSFCKSVLYAIDLVTNADEHGKVLKQRYTRSDLQISVHKGVRNNFVGLIVVDEISNLRLPKNGDAHPLLTFLLEVINTSGVPFVFIGNPNMRDIFSQTFKVARRTEKGGYVKMGQLTNQIWDQYAKVLWSRQVTKHHTDFDSELVGHLRQLSSSLPDLASRTFMEAQKCVIGTGDERITLSALNEGQRKALELTKSMLDISGRGQDSELKTKESDVDEFVGGNESNQVSADNTKNSKTTLRDYERPQHEEFETELYNLIAMDLLSLERSEPHLLRDASNMDNVMKYFDDNRVLYTPYVN